MRAIFRSWGNTPCRNDKFARWVMGVTTTSKTIFRGFAVTPSFPGAPSLRLVIILLTSDSEAGVINNAWKIHDVVQLRCEGYTYREIHYMVSIDVWFNSLALRESDTILNIGPGHVWVPSGSKSLPEPMVTGVRVTIPGPQWVNGLPMITYYPPMDQCMEIIKTNMWIWVYIYIYVCVCVC